MYSTFVWKFVAFELNAIHVQNSLNAFMNEWMFHESAIIPHGLLSEWQMAIGKY